MGTIKFSDRPKGMNYFDVARKAKVITNRLKNENEIRVHWLNEEFEQTSVADQHIFK